MVLVITNKNDITCDFIISELKKQLINYYRFNTEEIGKTVDIILDFQKNNFMLIDKNKNIKIRFDDIDSIYYRRPQLPNYDELSAEKELFLRNEVFFTLEGIYKLLENKRWLNSVFAIRTAENKIYQITLAKKMGFIIPDSYISNVPNSAINFINECNKNCIIKPIKSGLIGNDINGAVVFTNKLDASHMEKLNRIKYCPTYFQENIVKKSDIRVTIVGKKIFAAEILSQENMETKIDWRRGEHAELKYLPINLPEDIKKKCLNLLHYFNLNFGAIDLIRDTYNNFIFLEVNPNGQWAWIEKRLNFKISNAIVDFLK